MPSLSITKLYEDGKNPVKRWFDEFSSSIETFCNVTKLGTSNIADSAIDSSEIADGAVTSSKFQTSAVTTAKIADGAVTYPKLASTTVTESSSTGIDGGGDASGTTYMDITNLTLSITTTGRPVLIGIECDASSIESDAASYSQTYKGSTATIENRVRLRRDSTTLSVVKFVSVSDGSIGAREQHTPLSGFVFLDTPAAGTYTYKFQGYTQDSSTYLMMNDAKMFAVEL